jgi:SAM-dependent methyltransferase
LTLARLKAKLASMSGIARPPDSEVQVISPEALKAYKDKFNLSGQLDMLLGIHGSSPLTGKVVLEIGGSNIPKPFVLDVLKVKKWVSVDKVYAQNRALWPLQYQDAEVIPIARDLQFDALSDYAIVNGFIEYMPLSFAGRFDAIVSIDAFEHVLKFATMLDRAYDALKPGGQLTAMFSPIWSSHIGHHLWGVTDQSGRTFYIESSPIPPWGHLLMRPHEMYKYLLDHTDPVAADEIVYHVYHGEYLSRLFMEEYETYLRGSRFRSHSIRSFVPDVAPPPEVQLELERLHPGRKQFSQIGIYINCEKP